MKTRISSTVLILFFSLSFLGCKDQIPELSWTDYNTVEDVSANFYRGSRHDEREFLLAHKGDTLKVYGYINFDEGGYWYAVHTMTISKELAHTTNGSWLWSNPHVEIVIPERKPSLIIYEDTLAYVTGVVSWDEDVEQIELDVVEINSNPDNNEK